MNHKETLSKNYTIVVLALLAIIIVIIFLNGKSKASLSTPKTSIPFQIDTNTYQIPDQPIVEPGQDKG